MDHSLAPPIKKQNTVYQKLITSMKLIKDFIGTDEENIQSNDTIQNSKNSISSLENQSKQSITSEQTIERADDVKASIELTQSITSINYFSSISLLEILNNRQASATEDKFGTKTSSQIDDHQATKSAETIKNSLASFDNQSLEFANGKRRSADKNTPKAWSTGTIVLIILSIIAVVMGTSALIEKYSKNKAPSHQNTNDPEVRNNISDRNTNDEQLKSPTHYEGSLLDSSRNISHDKSTNAASTLNIPQEGEKYKLELEFENERISTEFTFKKEDESTFHYSEKLYVKNPETKDEPVLDLKIDFEINPTHNKIEIWFQILPTKKSDATGLIRFRNVNFDEYYDSETIKTKQITKLKLSKV